MNRHTTDQPSQISKSLCRAQTFAGLDAINPRVIKLRVAEIATFVDPSPPINATTELAGSLDGAALGARGPGLGFDERRGGS